MARLPLTYTGSSSDNLFVAGWKNGKEIKLRVKDLGCHGGINVDGITISNEYSSVTQLQEALSKAELVEGTIYIVTNSEGISVQFFYYAGSLTQIGANGQAGTNGLLVGATFPTYEDLSKAALEENKIYTVIDKGTIEQYIFKDNKIIQISGAVNEITDDSGDDNISEVATIPNGILDWNLNELINGNYRYKNHTELHTVISDMSSLVTGIEMFHGCPLVSFTGDLSSLKDGRGMFGKKCKLDDVSVITIIDCLPNLTGVDSPAIISIGYDSSKLSDEDKLALETEALNKNWVIDWFKDGSKLT